MRAVAVAAWLGSIVLVASPAHAAPPSAATTPDARAAPSGADRCTTAYDRTQRLRQASRLRAARSEALVCADAACPAVLRDDCTRWVDEIQRATPTVVVRVVGADGCDLVGARVAIDGEDAGDRSQGIALPVDPGAHRVRAEPAGAAPIERSVVVGEGERDRRIDLSAAPAGATCGAPRPLAPGDRPRPAPARPTPPLAYVLGGFGLASVAAGAVVAATGFAKRSDLGGCKPGCNPDDVDAMRRTFVVSDALVGVGVASLAAALVLYVTRPVAAPAWPSGSFGALTF